MAAMATRRKLETRWTHEANIERYGKLLHSNLSDLERRFVEKRLAEEKQAQQPLYERCVVQE